MRRAPPPRSARRRRDGGSSPAARRPAASRPPPPSRRRRLPGRGALPRPRPPSWRAGAGRTRARRGHLDALGAQAVGDRHGRSPGTTAAARRGAGPRGRTAPARARPASCRGDQLVQPELVGIQHLHARAPPRARGRPPSRSITATRRPLSSKYEIGSRSPSGARAAARQSDGCPVDQDVARHSDATSAAGPTSRRGLVAGLVGGGDGDGEPRRAPGAAGA